MTSWSSQGGLQTYKTLQSLKNILFFGGGLLDAHKIVQLPQNQAVIMQLPHDFEERLLGARKCIVITALDCKFTRHSQMENIIPSILPI